MAKKKFQRGEQNKLIPQKLRAKGDLVNDSSPEDYEVSEELGQENLLKKAPNKEKQKKNK